MVASYLPTSALEGIAVECAAQFAGAIEVAGMKAKKGSEHRFLQVQIEMRSEHGQQLEGGFVMHLADDPFALPQEPRRQRGEHVKLGAFTIDLDQINFRYV